MPLVVLTKEEAIKRQKENTKKLLELGDHHKKMVDKYGKKYDHNEDFIKMSDAQLKKFEEHQNKKPKSPTKKEVKKLMKEVEAEV